MNQYMVTVRATYEQPFMVNAKSKAEAIRKVKQTRNEKSEVWPWEGGIKRMHWSTAEAELDEENV